MKTIGALLVVFGIVSSILHFMEYELRILRWMNEMPPNTAMAYPWRNDSSRSNHIIPEQQKSKSLKNGAKIILLSMSKL